DAAIQPGSMIAVVFARERPFSAFTTRHLIRGGRKLLAPLRIGFLDALDFHGSLAVPGRGKVLDIHPRAALRSGSQTLGHDARTDRKTCSAGGCHTQSKKYPSRCSAFLVHGRPQPKVKANACAPASRNSMVKVRSRTPSDWRMS